MRHTIHRLRQKPVHHRKLISLGVSAGVTLALLGIWAVTLPTRLANMGPSQPAAVTASAPLEAVRQNFSQSYQTFKEDLNKAPAPTVNAQEDSTYVSEGVIITEPN